MTRINLIEPNELTDQHLIAEYREITMIPAALQRTIKSKSGLILNKIPQTFTLNKGHVKFFYNKGEYLFLRYNLLIKEMRKRGFKPDENRKFPKQIFIDYNLFHNWEPSLIDLEIIRKRIAEKIKQKPKWYRKTEIN